MSSREKSPYLAEYEEEIREADTVLAVLKIIARLLVFKIFR